MRALFKFGVLALLFPALWASGADLYVSQEHGSSDANDGLTKTTAKLTIQSAIDAAPSNAIIHVAAGTYEPIETTGRNELTILADEGPLVTFIDGRWSNRCAHLRTDSKAVYRGNDTIEGFTLKNGYTDYGGGVYFGTVSRCIIRDCGAYRYGGGASGSLVINSLVYDNWATKGGDQINNSTVYNTTIASPDDVTNTGDAYASVLYNCLVFGAVTDDKYGHHTASLVLPVEDRAKYANKDYIPYSDCTNIVGAGSIMYAQGEKDLLGHARKTDGKINFGCYEATSERPPMTCYVDASQPDDSGDGLTPETAYKTFDAALQHVANGGTIYAAPGVYDDGIRRNESDDCSQVNIIATEGPEKTFLIGPQYFAAAQLLPDDRLEGFTLWGLGGYVDVDDLYATGIYQGTAVNCIISNNEGVAVCYAKAVNCLITDNSTSGENEEEYALVYGSKLYNCTVTENVCDDYSSYSEDLDVCGLVASTAYNSIIYGNRNNYYYDAKDWVVPEKCCYNCILEDPFFVDSMRGNCHVVAESPAIDAGDPSVLAAFGIQTDLDGKPRFDSQGRVDAGCYQGAVWVPHITVVTDGPGLVSADRRFVPVGGSVTVWATKTVRPLVGFYIGENRISSNTPCVIQNVQTDLTVRVQFERTARLKDGDSIQNAIDAAWDGDTIELAAGTYAPFDATGRSLTIQGAGYGVTFIDGGGTNRCATLGTAADSSTNVLCEVTLINGSATNGGGARGGQLTDVVISNCVATSEGGGVAEADCRHVLIVHCSADVAGGGAADSQLTDSTLADNAAPMGDAVSATSAENSILAGGTNGMQTVSDTFVGAIDDLFFISPLDDDWRLAHVSPAVGKGFYPDGVRVCFISVTVSGNGSVQIDRAYTTADYPVTFTASSEVRPFLGWTENGTDILSTEKTFVRTGLSDDLSLAALFQTNLFADAVGGDDANDGFTAATAKKTLSAIASMAFDNESVAVADGSYGGFALAATNVAFASSGGHASTVVTGDVAVADASVAFTGFTFDGGSVSNGIYSGCLFDESAIADSRLADCTVWGTATDCDLVRTIVWHGAPSDVDCTAKDSCLVEPRLVDPADDDFRVAYDSVCVSNGVVWCGVEKSFATKPLPPVIAPPDGTVFSGETEVTISSESPRAKIWYSAAGRTPRFTDAARYTGSFVVTTTVVIKAVQRIGCMQSAIATATLMFAPAPWWRTADAVRLGNGESISFATNGSGYVTFEWMCDCEHDPTGGCNYDRLAVYVDGANAFARAIDGTTDWVTVKVRTVGRGDHVFRWAYEKDGYDEPGLAVEDAGWVRSVAWTAADSIPDLGASPSAEAIAEAIDGSGDSRLAIHITDAATYVGYRAWALRLEANGIEQETVRAHPRTWPSFALDQPELLATEISSDDLRLVGIVPDGASACRLSLRLADTSIGPLATEENLKAFFGFQATTDLVGVPFSADNLVIDGAAAQDGDAVFTLGPAEPSDAFFLKAEVMP